MSTDNHFEDVECGDDAPELEPLNPLVLNSTTGTAKFTNDTKTNDDNTMNSNISASLATSNEINDDDAIITSLLEAMGFNLDGSIDDSKQKCDYETAALAILSQNFFSSQETPSPGRLNQRVDWWRSPLHAAAYRGLQEVVAKLLEPACGADLQLQDIEGNTAPFIALKEGHVELAKYFVEKGSSLNTINPLSWAILTCDDEDAALDILPTNPPTIDQVNLCVDWCFSPLHVAAYRGMEKLVDKLLECDADQQLHYKEGNTAADIALKKDLNKLAKRLINKGSTLNTINCLWWAIKKRDIDTVFDILSRMTPTRDQLNDEPNWRNPILHSAVRKKLPNVVDKLIQIGAEPQLINKYGRTAADVAMNGKNYKLAEFLIQKGSFFNKEVNKNIEPFLQLLQHIQDGDEASAVAWLSNNTRTIHENHQNIKMFLIDVAAKEMDKVVDKLMEEFKDITDTIEWNVSDTLTDNGEFKAAAYLLEKGFSSFTKETNYKPILHLMKYIEENDEYSAITMLSKKPPIAPTAEQLNVDVLIPPLHFAILNSQEKVISKLLDCGADPQLKGGFGNTAADIAMYMGKYKLAKCLIEKKSTLHEKNEKIIPLLPLMEYIEDGDEVSALDLLETNALDNEQLNILVEWPPIQFAAHHGLAKVVKKLLDCGADRNLRTSGWSEDALADHAVDVAIRSNRPEVVELLVSRDSANNFFPGSHETYLSHAVVRGFDDIMVKLINKGADTTKLPPNAKIPSSVMGKCFDSSISWDKGEKDQNLEGIYTSKKKKEERKLLLNFQIIMSKKTKRTKETESETENVKEFYSALNSSDLLSHPIFKTFLFKKWEKIEWMFCLWIGFKFAFFMFLFSTAIFLGPNTSSGNQTDILKEYSPIDSGNNYSTISSDYTSNFLGPNTTSENQTDSMLKEHSSLDPGNSSSTKTRMNYIWAHVGFNSTSKTETSYTNKNRPLENAWTIVAVLVFGLPFLLTEHFQAVKALDNEWKMHRSKIPSYYSSELKNVWKFSIIKLPAYFTDHKNIIQWIVIGCLFTIFLDSYFVFLESSDRQTIFGVLLPLSCWEFLHQMGHIPSCTHIILIFNMVLWTFVTYLTLYGLLIIAFAASFYVILPPSDDPEYPLNFFKLLAKFTVMFSGEQEFMEVPFPKEQNWFEIILFLIFLILVPIVLMNVLNALAVRDIQEMMKEAEVPMLEQLLEKIHLIETIIHSLEKYDYFKILPNLRLFDQTSSIEFYPFKENTETGFIGSVKKHLPKKITKLFLNTYQVIEKECIHGPNGALAILSLKQDEEGTKKGRKINDDLTRQMNLQIKQVHLELKEMRKKEENNTTEKSNDGASQDKEGNEIISDDFLKQMIKNVKNLNKDQMTKINHEINEMLLINQGSQPTKETETPVIDGFIMD